MRKFSKQILKSFRNLCEGDDGGSPKGQPTVQNTPQEQMVLYHGQGGMAAYNIRTIRDIPQWWYTGIPAYTAPDGTVVIPPNPRTGLFLPNMLPGVQLINTPGPWGVNFYTFDYNQLGGMSESNAYNLLMLNMFTNPDWINGIESGWALNNVDLLIAQLTTDIRDAFNQGVPGFNQGDHSKFIDTFFDPNGDTALFMGFMRWWSETLNDMQDGTLNWNEIEFPGNSQS